MTEENKKPRPNANYNLSKPDSANSVREEELTFYYSREHRLSKASQNVKDLYAEKKNAGRFNLLGPLIADKPRATLFLSIILICVAMFVLSIVNKLGSSYSLEGNKIEISGTRFEGAVLVVLTKTIKKTVGRTAGRTSGQVYTGPVDIAVSYPVNSGAEISDEDYPVFYHRIFFSLAPVERYRFAVPFDTQEQIIILQTEKNTLQIKYKPE
jgi:hypothetical protein